jgi:hypothetical protein
MSYLAIGLACALAWMPAWGEEQGFGGEMQKGKFEGTWEVESFEDLNDHAGDIGLKEGSVIKIESPLVRFPAADYGVIGMEVEVDEGRGLYFETYTLAGVDVRLIMCSSYDNAGADVDHVSASFFAGMLISIRRVDGE